MPAWTEVAYRYDGSLAGFLSCVFESYAHHEAPACFLSQTDSRFSLWPERVVETDQAQARRVYQSLARRISSGAQSLVAQGFLTCLPERELHLWRYIRLGLDGGAQAVLDLTDDRVHVLEQAVQHLGREAHLLKGFVRFSEQDDFLVAEIEPKNRVLPLLRPHFCARFPNERIVIYDRTHREALFATPDGWDIVPLEAFSSGQPGEAELAFRRLWRQFYKTIAIEGRINHKLRRTHMPKRYWNTMTEFLTDPEPALPPEGPAR